LNSSVLELIGLLMRYVDYLLLYFVFWSDLMRAKRV